MARTTEMKVGVDKLELEERMKKIVALALDAERDRIRRAIQEMPVHFVDVRFHPHDPVDMRHAVLLSDAVGATFPSDER